MRCTKPTTGLWSEPRRVDKKRSGGGIVVGKSRREETTSKLVYCKRDDDFLDDIETYAEVLLLTWFEVQLYMAMDESGRRWVPPFTR